MFKNKDFWKNFISALATLASIATLITFLYNWHADSINSWILIALSILILGICFAYGWWMTRRKSRIELEIHPSFKLTISFGDLFNDTHKGIIVIPVNQYFDTDLNGSLVSRHSVLGSFINKYWQDRVNELDGKIENALTGVTSDFDDNRSVGKKTRYSLGTCANIFDGGNTYVLVATTEKNSNGQSILSKKDYPVVIGSLFTQLELIRPSRSVYMPLFGTGRGRMKRSLQRILSFLIDTLDFKHSNLSFPYGVNIIIKKAYEKDVNLNDVANHFDKALKD